MTLTLPNPISDKPDSVKGMNVFVAGLDAELQHSKKSVIAGATATSSTSYVDLLDRVDNLYANALSDRTLIQVAFSAVWAGTVSNGNISAAIFIGNNQLKTLVPNGASVVNETVAFFNAATTPGRQWIISDRDGLLAVNTPAVNVVSGITTGMSVSNVASGGGVCNIIVPNNLGVFSVGIRFKVTAGTVSVQERKLWVRALAFTGS